MHNCHNPVQPTILPKQTANQHAPMQSYDKDGTGCTGKKHPVDFGGPMGDPRKKVYKSHSSSISPISPGHRWIKGQLCHAEPSRALAGPWTLYQAAPGPERLAQDVGS